jgi:PBP1b-binding outer membrane lipoprotein LpoB
MKVMKKILALIVLISFLTSCARSVTPYEAASHHYKKCRDMR